MSQPLALAALPGPLATNNSAGLSRQAKAAIIVQLLLNEDADIPLASLPDEMQAQLTQLLGNMRYVDRDTLNTVIAEFAQELEAVGLSFPGDMAGALQALDGRISERTSTRLRKEAGVRQSGDPWARISGLEVDKLQQLILSESTEVAAVVMSRIDVAKAAQVLAQLPGEKARRISYAVSMTRGVTPEAVDRIGLALAAQVDAEPPKAFKAGPDERLGAILNYSNAQTREDMLASLQEQDAGFANAVRRAIFTFANIPDRLRAEDVPKLTRDLPVDVLATAIAAVESDAEKRASEFLLSNMSKRMAGTLREEADTRGTVRKRAGEEAMNAVVAAIRNLVAVGEIELRVPEQDD